MASRQTTLPAPTAGWNTRDPIDGMQPIFATDLENFFPGTRDISLRKGSRVWATGVGSGAVETLAEWSGDDGSRKLIACSATAIYDATTFNAAATQLATLEVIQAEPIGVALLALKLGSLSDVERQAILALT
jgi:GTP-dependent phosphoenolpyruvate carboxykinase